MPVRAKYVGDGTRFFSGIPASDLEEEDYQALDPEQRAMLRKSPLYEVKTDDEMDKLTKATKSQPTKGPPAEATKEPPTEAKPSEAEPKS